MIALIAYNFWPIKPLPKNVKIDKLIVLKSERKLMAMSDGTVVKAYSIALGKEPKGHKHFEGDNKTPEGHYIINAKNNKSSFYLNLGVSYPNEADQNYAGKMGKSPGGDIKIHGIRNGKWYVGRLHRLRDWTAGCIALTNPEMDELFSVVEIGTPIEIKP